MSKQKISDAKIANIRALNDKGYPLSLIAEKVGVSRVTVHYHTSEEFRAKTLNRARSKKNKNHNSPLSVSESTWNTEED